MAGCGIESPSSNSFTNIYLWNLGSPYNAGKIYIPMWQYNPRHNGVYGDIILTGVKKEFSNIPDKFYLYQNYPNPFNPGTVIRYSLMVNSNVQLKVYDICGHEISVLVNEFQKAGTYETQFANDRLSSGIYFYTLTAGNFKETKKMILTK
jgi:hypothetical protein